MQAGREALDRGELPRALAWLDRARRYAPEDPAPLLSLAAARLASGEAHGALADFRTVAETCDVREAWLGQAASCLRLGRLAEATAALAHALARHRWDGVEALTEAVARAAGRPGWCALAADATVAVRAHAEGRVQVAVDGTPLDPGAAVPATARRVRATLGGVDLLGSPIDAARIHRIEGVVQVAGDGLEGWAWHPGDADRDPVLTLSDGRRALSITATDQSMAAPRPLTRPRRFLVPGAALAGFAGAITVLGAGGAALAGSPLDPGAMRRAAAAAARMIAARWPWRGRAGADESEPLLVPIPAEVTGAPATAPPRPERPVAIVVPVHRGLRQTLDCLEAVRRTAPDETALLVVDDASPEPALAAALDRLAARGRIRLLRLARNHGFAGAANVGLRAAAGLPGAPDLVLLNSDTVPASGWLRGLRAAVHGAPDVGTATPLSSDATIVGYPDPAAPGPPPDGAALALLARQAARANPSEAIEVPTAVGFCMYIRRECLRQTGLLRADLFAQGYGEENDFCLRARHLGWRHVAVPGVFVAHHGGQSFGSARPALLARNLALLEQLHPGYRALIADWTARDPLHPARRRLDTQRWAAACRDAPPAVLLVTHDGGGGVERQVRDRCAALRAQGRRPLLLRPVLDRSGDAAALERRYLPGWCRLDEPGQDWPNLRFVVARETDELLRLLRAARPVGMEVHHLLGHDHAVLDLARRLGIPYEVRVHDYAWFCPRITLLGAQGHYCGEPAEHECEACVADLGSRLEEPIGVAELRRRSQVDLAGAVRVVAPSHDAAARLARRFTALRPELEAHESDRYPPLAGVPARARVVCVVGAIGPEKGYDVLLACARDARARALDLRFVVVGHTIDDERLYATRRVTVTGPFQPEEAVPLIQAQRADIAFIPSVWPETWCLALGEAWRAGLAVAAFDLGAQAERIHATGRGWLLPLGLPAARVNNTFLALPPLAGNRRVMQTT